MREHPGGFGVILVVPKDDAVTTEVKGAIHNFVLLL